MAEKADRVVTFNGISFDGCLINACWSYLIPEQKHFDIFKKIMNVVCPDKFQKGFGLESMSEANLGRGKSGNGALAPVEWQQGRLGSVIDYCLDDIALTCGLYEKILSEGFLVCPKTGSKIEIQF